MHSGPLSSLSPTLQTLLTGEMIEAKLRHVDWSDVDENTFIRLCEYAYNRDYTPPSPLKIDDTNANSENGSRLSKMNKKKKKKKNSDFRMASSWDNGVNPEAGPDPEPVPEPEPEPPIEEWPEPVPEPEPIAEEGCFDDHELPYREKSIWSRHLRDKFSGLKFDLSAHKQASANAYVPRGNKGSSEDFTPVFLGSAQLYVLADKYGIDSLSQLVLHKLERTLKQFKLCHGSEIAVFEFVRFIYANTRCRVRGRDPLRTLAVIYVVSVLGQLGGNELFHEVLREGGDFVVDFWQEVWS